MILKLFVQFVNKKQLILACIRQKVIMLIINYIV